MDMYRLSIDVVLRVFSSLRYLEGIAENWDDDHTIGARAHEASLLTYVNPLCDLCEEIKIRSSLKQAERLKYALENHASDFTYREYRQVIADLRRRIEDDLEDMTVLVVENVDEYTKPELFGSLVATKFPSTTLDIEEAGKCFALGRNTACVFHLMRVMEIGVKAFGAGLNILGRIRSAQPSWGEVLRLTNEQIQANNRSGDPTWTDDKRGFFENVQADLMTVKNAWRNTTMHVENSYDEERAEDIYNAVKAFMRHLAKHIDESGDYTP